ncbi:MAG: GNAT family N-acetyltransferase [Gammaproteobacteria bacterium]|nr:GNAT family N-acetyltransferase [Gammaproteobacteria bacterium]
MILESKNLKLKPVTDEDYNSYRQIKPSEEFYLMVGSDPTQSIFLDDNKIKESFGKLKGKKHYWLVYLASEIIGVAFLHSFDEVDRRARYAVGIYNEKHWNKHYGEEITHKVLEYAFKKLNLHRVDLRVLEYNKRGIACYERCGFSTEGVLRENAFINNEWHNDILMSILFHEYVVRK